MTLAFFKFVVAVGGGGGAGGGEEECMEMLRKDLFLHAVCFFSVRLWGVSHAVFVRFLFTKRCTRVHTFNFCLPFITFAFCGFQKLVDSCSHTQSTIHVTHLTHK